MSSKFRILGAVLSVIALVGAGCNVFKPKDDPFKVTQAPTTSVALGISPVPVPAECMPSRPGERALGDTMAYATDEGFCFQYDPKIFNPTSTMGAVVLKSVYYVDKNVEGPFTHRFALQFFVDNRPLKAVMGDPSGAIGFYPPKGLDANGVPVGATAFSAAGVEGHRITLSAAGTNVDYVFLPMNENKTMVVIYTYFTDALKKNVKPRPFTEAQEKAQFDAVMKSLKFTTTTPNVN